MKRKVDVIGTTVITRRVYHDTIASESRCGGGGADRLLKGVILLVGRDTIGEKGGVGDGDC